jgi:DNA repair protein RadC
MREAPALLPEIAGSEIALDLWAPQAPQEQGPRHHQLGHRDRLRQRARASAFKGIPDYELLELFLYRSIPQRDVKPLAKALLARFGALGAVLAAREEELRTVAVKDAHGRALRIGPEAALDLCALHELGLRVAAEQVKRRPVIATWSALLDYVRQALSHEPREQFRVLFLDVKNQLIADEVMNRGTVDHAPVYPREVVRRALELAAKAIILVHNHPSGDPTPSQPDIEMTRQIIDAARTLRISVHDHLVVGRDGVASFKALGLM